MVHRLVKKIDELRVEYLNEKLIIEFNNEYLNLSELWNRIQFFVEMCFKTFKITNL